MSNTTVSGAEMASTEKKDVLWRISKFFRSFTIEPVIFMYIFSIFLVNGAEINTNLLMWKVCKIEMGLEDDVCENLSADENEDVQTDVQKRVNDLLLIYQWIGSAPALFYSLFVGSLSDSKFGRKPLLLFPIFGQVNNAGQVSHQGSSSH